MASRSRRVMLSLPSSLQGHSDFPAPVTNFLPVSSDLKLLTAVRVLQRRWDLRYYISSSFTACHRPYSGSFAGAYALSYPANIGLLSKRRRSASILISRSGLSRNRTLPVISVRRSLTKLHRSLYAAACGFGKHP